jgi:hypothetical protein
MIFGENRTIEYPSLDGKTILPYFDDAFRASRADRPNIVYALIGTLLSGDGPPAIIASDRFSSVKK